MSQGNVETRKGVMHDGLYWACTALHLELGGTLGGAAQP